MITVLEYIKSLNFLSYCKQVIKGNSLILMCRFFIEFSEMPYLNVDALKLCLLP